MADSARTPWLFGPFPDLLLGAGLGYGVLFAALALGGHTVQEAQPAAIAGLLAILLSGPHYGATLLRVYEHRSDRRAYAIFSVWATLLIAAWFVVGVHSALVGSLLFTVYLTWSPWHYTGQNFGISVMFLRRGGVPISQQARRLLHASFALSFLVTFLVLHGSLAARGYVPNPVGYGVETIELLPLGIPHAWTARLLPWAVLGSFLCATGAFALLARQGSWRVLGPAAALFATQTLWFTLPMSLTFWRIQTGIVPLDRSVEAYYVFWIAMGHALQYMWISAYYARAKPDWQGYGHFFAKTLGAGAAIWTLPAIFFASGHLGSTFSAEKLTLLVAAGVNVHHFMLDGVIWKLRNSRVASVLIRAEPSDEPTAAPAPGPIPVWRRRLVWSVCTASAVAAVGAVWVQGSAVSALNRGDDAQSVRTHLDWLARVGRESSQQRAKLGKLFARDGDLEAAQSEFARSLALRPNREALSGLAQLAGQREDWGGMFEAVQAQHELGALDPALAGAAVQALYAHGERDRARILLDAVLESSAGSAEDHARLGSVARDLGDPERAVELYRESLSLEPDRHSAANNLAWLLASYEEVADPTEAVRLAEQAVAEGGDDPNYLDTLAAAYAAAGRFEEAVGAASRAAELARARDQDPVGSGIEQRLALYRAGQPYRTPEP